MDMDSLLSSELNKYRDSSELGIEQGLSSEFGFEQELFSEFGIEQGLSSELWN